MIINSIFLILAVYLIIGFVFWLIFIFKGLNTVDEGAHGSTIGFKLIIIPGTMVFWPLLINKWVKTFKNKTHD